MRQTDFYTGEPVETGSPPISAEQQAAEMASFGKYDYDPSMRQSSVVPGGYGYTWGGGIGMPPPGYSPYGNPMPTYQQYYMGGNPVYNNPYNPYYNQQYYQRQYNPPSTFTVPGLSPFGEYLPPADWEDRVEDMKMEYVSRRIDEEAKSEVDMQSQGSVYGYNPGFYGGYNYYGAPYWNPYRYNSINSEFSHRIEQLRDEARENRMQFTMQIARLAHNFTHQYISEEALRERYTGKTVEIPESFRPPANYEDYYLQCRLNNLVPFDNSQIYRDHRAKLQREYSEIIPKDANMKEAFAGMGVIQAKWDMEEEQHRRRNASGLYNSSDNAYKHYVRKKAKERYAAEKGVVLPGSIQRPTMTPNGMAGAYVQANPVLSQAAHLADDGTLNVSLSISQNVGSDKGATYTVHNSQEAEYDEKRERFGAFLSEIKGSIYLDQQKKQKLEGYSYK